MEHGAVNTRKGEPAPGGERVETLPRSAALVERQPSPLQGSPVAAPAVVSRSRGLQRISSDIVPYLAHRVQYIGRAGVIGVALLVFSVVCFLSAISPLRQELVSLRTELAQSEQGQTTHRRVATDLTPGAELRNFVNTLPTRSELPAITEQVVQQASAAGLVLERGNYDFSVTHSGRIVRARLSFPVQGTYPRIRQFVEGTLREIPVAAVDGPKLERDTTGDSELSAEIRFAVFLRNDQ
jgi:hypothetical protein